MNKVSSLIKRAGLKLKIKNRRGVVYLEPSYVFAPYMPLQHTQMIVWNDSCYRIIKKAGLRVVSNSRKGVVTCYGKKLVSNDFYSQVKFTPYSHVDK